MKQIIFQSLATKALRKMPANTASRIVAKIEAYAADPSSQQNHIKALKGTDTIRLRVGDWRVIMQDGVVLNIVNIGPRGGIYE